MYKQRPRLDQLCESKSLSDKSEASFDVFGHCSERLNETSILVHGGFGNKNGCHQRLSELQLLNIQSGDIVNVPPEEGSHVLGKFAAKVKDLENEMNGGFFHFFFNDISCAWKCQPF